ncbi:MAG: CPBP family glutamic-type intramembrane protease [Acidobacteriota bacterium]
MLILVYLWWGRFQYHHRLLLVLTYAGAGAIILANHLFFGDNRRQLGLRLDNIFRAALGYGAATLAGALAVASIGWLWGDFRLDRWSDISIYLAWAFAQQYILQNFLRLRGKELLPRQSGWLMPVVLAAGLFALYHLPNYPLMALTFTGAMLWGYLFTQTPNLLCAGLSQACLGIVLILFFKYDLLDQFKIGQPGYRYEAYGDGVQVTAGYDSQGRPFIATLPGPDWGTAATVRVFTPEGQRLAQWNAFEGLDFSGSISAGDLGFAPGDEIAVAPGPGPSNPPLVRIFDLQGEALQEFQPEALEGGYGAWISARKGGLYVCPGPGPQHPQTALLFTPEGRLVERWDFPEIDLVNGIRATWWHSDKLVLWGTVIPSNPATLYTYDTGSKSVKVSGALPATFGLNAAPVRLGSGKQGIAVAPGYLEGYPPWVKVFEASGKLLYEFSALDDPKSCGSNLAAVDIDGDGIDEVILGEGACPGRPSQVRIHRLDGTFVTEWRAYD